MRIRKATIQDVAEMQELINSFADNGELLPRSLNMLYEDLRDFILVEEEGRIVGTCALHINWEDLAEIKALTIAIPLQGKGLGRQVVEACLDEARVLGVTRVFALTYQPEFFKRIGFHEIEKAELPHKVWNECINCVKFPNCGEVAVIRSVD